MADINPDAWFGSYIDISVPVTDAGMPRWPGSPAVRFEPRLRMSNGDNADDTNLSLNVHTGTHIDAPSHFVPGAPTIDQVGLDTLLGPCFVADCRGTPVVTAAALEGADIPADTKRLLLKTDNVDKWGPEFDESFVGIGMDGAAWITERGIGMVGIDYLSVQPYSASDELHQHLLGADVVVLEGLNLAHVEAGHYVLVCLPLALQGLEGAPARAVLLPIP